MNFSNNITDWIGKNFFDVIPMPAAVIDVDLNILTANRAYEQHFGSWENQKCYQIFDHQTSACPGCKSEAIFKKDSSDTRDEVGFVVNRESKRYIKYAIPVASSSGEVPFLVELTIDIADVDPIGEKYRLLFENVPCDVLIIDRNFQIVDTNKRSKEMFGPIEGAYCYEILKNRQDRCRSCNAGYTFEDGLSHSGRSTVKSKSGKIVELLVTTVPYAVKDGKVELVMEMAVDITRTLDLQDKLKTTSLFMESLIHSSLYGIIAVDENEKLTILNEAAMRMFNIADKDQLQKDDLIAIFPMGFWDDVSSSTGPVYLHETEVKSIDGASFPVRLTGFKLLVDRKNKGFAFWVHDIREIKNLEAQKLEAERLAAVGQTVAGLAHGIKNVLTGLEGGIYLLNSGLQNAKAERVAKGMEMLNRNTTRVSTFVKEFLNFSKGQTIETTMMDPVQVAREVINMYSVKIDQLGIALKTEYQEGIEPAALDGEGMHECLANLLGNAIDACRISENGDNLQIVFRVLENDGSLVYEVVDNGCGMDYDIKRKIFTTFFTTKGLGGTGLGLLMTKKIIQQLGGKVEFDSELDRGTTFRISLPRNRLPEPIETVSTQ